MKVVVLEIHKNTVVILSDKGCVMKIKNRNYVIGQEVLIDMEKTKMPKRIFAYALAASIFLFLGLGIYTYATPYTYISLDVNPSIEYSLNRFRQVLSVTGVNDDGTNLLSEINISNLKNKNIQDALSLTIEQLSESGYFNLEESGMIITTSSTNSEDDITLAKDLQMVANEQIAKLGHNAFVMSEVITRERLEEARSAGVTPGKMLLVEQLAKSAGTSETINEEEWLQKSIREILKQTHQYKEQHQESNGDSGNGLPDDDRPLQGSETETVKEEEKNREQEMNSSENASPNSQQKQDDADDRNTPMDPSEDTQNTNNKNATPNKGN